MPNREETTYESAARDYFAEASSRFQFTISSAEHDAALVEEVVSSIRDAMKAGLEKLAREAHGDCSLQTTTADAIDFAMEDLGEQLDGPICGLWHDMNRFATARDIRTAMLRAA